MKFERLQELLKVLQNREDEFKVEMMDVYEDYVNVYFEGDNVTAMSNLEFDWNFECEMHNSNNSFVRFKL